MKHTIPKMKQYLTNIIAPDYTDHGQSAYVGSPGRGIDGAKNDLKNSLDKFDDFRGLSIYRIQNGKMIETWHVIDGLPATI